MHLKGNEDAWLVRISYEQGADSYDWGSDDQQLVASVSSPNGEHHVEVRARNWPFLAALGTATWYADVTNDELDELVSLSTGGAVDLEYVLSTTDESVFEAAPNFATKAFASVVAK